MIDITQHILQSYQNQILLAANLEADKERKRQLLFQERQKILDVANKMWEDLLYESTVYPQRVLVNAQIILKDMKNMGAMPEAFENDTEREKIIFLWRKFLDIAEKCTKQLPPEQVDQCTQALQAISTQRYIDAILPRLDSYKQFLQLKIRLASEKKRCQRNERILNTVLAMLVVFWLAWLRMKNSLVSFENIMGVFFVVLAPGAVLASWLRSTYRKSEKALLPYQHIEKEKEFWSTVMANFNGIPSHETLEQKRKEQDKIIRVIFGENNQ